MLSFQHTEKAAVVPVMMGWNDVGSWSALWDLGDKDGDGNVVVGDAITVGSKNAYIPIGITHALENPGKVPLHIIEVQSGTYLGEDDIVRFEDRYGRVPQLDGVE